MRVPQRQVPSRNLRNSYLLKFCRIVWAKLKKTFGEKTYSIQFNLKPPSLIFNPFLPNEPMNCCCGGPQRPRRRKAQRPPGCSSRSRAPSATDPSARASILKLDDKSFNIMKHSHLTFEGHAARPDDVIHRFLLSFFTCRQKNKTFCPSLGNSCNPTYSLKKHSLFRFYLSD